MIIRMHTKEPPTKAPAGATLGADHVFNVFRQVDTPVSKLKKTAIVMLIVFFGGVIAAVATFSFLWETGGLAIGALPLIVSLLDLIALPFVPGIIVRGEFRDDVIPACRRVCTEREIVSGALQSLRFLWGRYLLYPGPRSWTVVPQPRSRVHPGVSEGEGSSLHPPKLQDVSGLSSRPHRTLQPGVTGGFGEARSQGH